MRWVCLFAWALAVLSQDLLLAADPVPFSKPPKEIYNSEPSKLPFTLPEDAVKGMTLPPGFRVDLFAAEPDLNCAVRQGLQLQIAFRVPLHTHRLTLLQLQPFLFTHCTFRMTEATVLQRPCKAFVRDINRQYALLSSVFVSPASAIHHP